MIIHVSFCFVLHAGSAECGAQGRCMQRPYLLPLVPYSLFPEEKKWPENIVPD